MCFENEIKTSLGSLTINITPNECFGSISFEDLVKNYKVKIYLSKDSFMSEQYFKKTYNNFGKFKEIKNKYDPLNLISSFQSRRIGL